MINQAVQSQAFGTTLQATQQRNQMGAMKSTQEFRPATQLQYAKMPGVQMSMSKNEVFAKPQGNSFFGLKQAPQANAFGFNASAMAKTPNTVRAKTELNMLPKHQEMLSFMSTQKSTTELAAAKTMGEQLIVAKKRDNIIKRAAKKVARKINPAVPPKTLEALDKYFPGHMTGKECEDKVFAKLKTMGFTTYNTIFTDCSCPDEINHDDPSQGVCMRFQKRYGNVFPLSGLGGLPFTGKTGWAAMASHVPDDGHIVVLIGPHVGIDCDGNIGKVNRKGQHQCSSACGAAIGALAALEGGKKDHFVNGMKDFQMDAVINLLEPYTKDLQKAENK